MPLRLKSSALNKNVARALLPHTTAHIPAFIIKLPKKDEKNWQIFPIL